VIVFIDSDCVVHPDTLERIQRAFEADPELGALFGSYDDRPDAPGIVSRYRNLLHHFTHHRGAREAGTFWAGCGACRREVFERSGGFDERYAKPMIEDIELGMRWRAAGVKIHLLPEIQVTHLKRWRLFDMIRVDVARRAVPWTRLMLERKAGENELNVTRSQRLCVALVYAAALSACGLIAWSLVKGAVAWPVAALPLLLLVPVLWINRGLYALFARRYGGLFAVAGVALHLLYYGYGGIGFLYARLTHRFS
jgi:GT2 family glycosyltransferase